MSVAADARVVDVANCPVVTRDVAVAVTNPDAFRIILVDPPWAYQNWTDKVHGAARSHYTCESETDLGSIPVGGWTVEESVLFLWTCWPKLDEAMRLIERWGFSYVTGLPWVKIVPSRLNEIAQLDQPVKIRRGIGFWFQSTSELLLVARRGSESPGRTAQLGILCGSERQFYAPIGDHSAKPIGIHNYIEKFFEGPYLELFAREERVGWTCWGRDIGYELGSFGVRYCGDKET